jgi:hypothetical protein
VIELAPAGRSVVFTLATPLLSNVPVVSGVVLPLRKKSTVPVGVPPPGLTTAIVAVKVTLCPTYGEVGKKVTVVVVDACPTCTFTAGVEVLVWKFGSPPYFAVIELAPAPSAVVGKVAAPLLKVPVPSEVEPLKNSTVPLGVPAPGLTGATVAVSVTLSPLTGVLGEKVTVVVVVACDTGTTTADEVLVPYVVSPWYTAVIELVVLTGSEVTSRVATPLSFKLMVPSEVVPLRNSTVPVGVDPPEFPVTVAWSATDSPYTAGLGVAVSAVELSANSVKTTESEFVPPV